MDIRSARSAQGWAAGWIAALGVAWAAPAAGAGPEPEDDFTREGWYVQAQGAYAREFFDTPAGVEAHDAIGGNVAAGYRVHPLAAMELELEYVDQFDFGNAGPAKVESTFNLAVNGRLYPLATLFHPGGWGNRFQPFLEAGPAWMWVREKQPDGEDRNKGSFAGRVGLGLESYVTENVVIVVYGNFMAPCCENSEYTYGTAGIGLQYRFGGGEED